MPGKHSMFKLRSGNKPSPLELFRGAKSNPAASELHSFSPGPSSDQPESMSTEYSQPEYISTVGSNDYDQQNIDTFDDQKVSRFSTKDWARQDRADESKEFKQSQVDAAMAHNPNLISDLKKKFAFKPQSQAYIKKHAVPLNPAIVGSPSVQKAGVQKMLGFGGNSKPMFSQDKLAMLRKYGLINF